MKLFKTLLTILFISLLSSPSWSVNVFDLVERNDLYYEKFSDVPFSGEVTGKYQGSFKNGKFDGTWISYDEDGQLRSKVNYKNGKLDGAWVGYHNNGQLRSKGNYKNGKLDGAEVEYWINGQLKSKGNFTNGKKEGVWVRYNKDGTVWEEYTGTYKNRNKISD